MGGAGWLSILFLPWLRDISQGVETMSCKNPRCGGNSRMCDRTGAP